MSNQCVDCGKPISEGAVRCATDRGKALQRQHLVDTLPTDTLVLQAIADGKSSGEIGKMLGVSRSRAADKMKDAKRRQGLRDTLGVA
jgi:hypothetical protein